MPANDSPAVLVARFLKANNYLETLNAFLTEAGLPPDTGTLSKGDLTIENVLHEKKVFDLSLQFEKLDADEQLGQWQIPAPSRPTILKTLPAPSNILNVSIEAFTSENNADPDAMLVSTADRRLSKVSTDPSKLDLIDSITHLHDAPILSWTTLGNQYVVTTSMSGRIALSSGILNEVFDSRKDHSKYVVKVTSWTDENSGQIWLATAGWDAKIHIHHPTIDLPRNQRSLNPPVATIALPTNPEAILFLRHPQTLKPILIASRRDSTFLYYYDLSFISQASPSTSSDASPPSPPLLGRQNLTPYSNAWIAFTPCALAPSPLDPHTLAIATSSTPHMKLIIVRLLFPSTATSTSDAQPLSTSSQNPLLASTSAQQANAADKLLQERESAAIIFTTSTFAPQTPYSTPNLVWRPDGSGIWVNGDDGVVRGVEVKSGKVVARLGGLESTAEGEGHEVGSKVRCLWAGMVGQGDEKEEWVVSGGFDQRLVVWRCARPGGEGQRQREGSAE
ncbi:MAG: hypothetical protein M1820_004952 [Bogoriella megaspora]|nr:MAG: hypothetical protein M1820_004952 [Bogoriella megaspora]